MISYLICNTAAGLLLALFIVLGGRRIIVQVKARRHKAHDSEHIMHVSENVVRRP